MTVLSARGLARLWAPVKRLMLVGFLVDLAVSCLSLGAQFLAIDLQASPLLLGLLGTAGASAYTVACVFSGTVSDRLGRKAPAVAACALAATVWLLMAFARSPYHLLVLAPFSGASLAFLWPSAQAWLAEFSGDNPRRLNRNLSLFNILWTAGIMTGPLIAGLTWSTSRYLPFLIACGLGYLAALCVVATPVADGDSEGEATVVAQAPPGVVQLFLLLAWMGNFASWFARGAIGSLFPKLGTDLLYSHQLVGMLLFLLGVAQLLAFGLARLTQSWQYRLGILIGAELLGLVGMTMAVGARQPLWFALGFGAVGLCGGVTYVSSLTYALQGRAGARGQRSGFHEAVLGLGIVLGPLVGGLLAQGLNLRAPFVAGAVVFGLAMVGQVVLYCSRRQTLGPAEAAADPARSAAL